MEVILKEEYVGHRGESVLLKDFLYSLTVFSEDTKIKRRTLVLWWIGLKLVHYTLTASGIFSVLVRKGILKPAQTRSHNQVIDLCTIDPTFQRKLKYSYNYKRNQEVVTEGRWRFYCDENNVRALILNVDQKYLNSKEIINNFEKEKSMKVVQLGKWHCVTKDETIDSKENKSQDHIEVDYTDFLKKVGENVTHISLRGISSIDELPESIGKLAYLEVLDLRACHNLKKLPQKRRMLKFFQKKWFASLSYLDISDCYLLDQLPKWVCEISYLEVLKGFVVGSGGKKEESCRLQDLSKLKMLRKLTIRIAKFLDPEEASGLKLITWLSVLTVTWSINENKNDSDKVRTISFPESLIKLDIRCYPEDKAVEFLNPEALPNLERLYIRGGSLKRLIVSNSNWKVKILRLKFLKHLEFEWNDLCGIFPTLEYVEYKQCPLLQWPKNRTAWNTNIDGPFPVSPEGPLKIMIDYNYERTLAENKKKVWIQLTSDDDYDWVTAKLDLVVALDVSGSPGADIILEHTKTALLFVIEKLRPTDRLSIVTFSTKATKLWPLLEVDESSQKNLEYLVNNLKLDDKKTDGTTNIFDGFQMGLDILKDRQNSRDHFAAIILMSKSKQSKGAGDAAHIPIGDVAVHTFGIEYDHDPVVLQSIAYNSMGGRFSFLEDSFELKKAFVYCLGGHLKVIIQDLTLTITPIVESSTLQLASPEAEYYPQIKDNDAGSVTVKLGYLSSDEDRSVSVNLVLSAGVDGSADVLKVSYSYRSSSGTVFTATTRLLNLICNEMVNADEPTTLDVGGDKICRERWRRLKKQ